MARYVHEIMSREVVRFSPEDRVADALATLVALGVAGAPVVGPGEELVGFVSWRDLVGLGTGETVGSRMTEHVATVRDSDVIDDAAHRLAAEHLHQFTVVDATGHLVGLVSAVDLVAGLTGVPATHPRSLPHVDALFELAWSDDQPLDAALAARAPKAAGVLVLVHGRAGVEETVVHVEDCEDVRARITEIVTVERARHRRLSGLLARGFLRARYAEVADAAARDGVRTRIVSLVRDLPPELERLLGG